MSPVSDFPPASRQGAVDTVGPGESASGETDQTTLPAGRRDDPADGTEPARRTERGQRRYAAVAGLLALTVIGGTAAAALTVLGRDGSGSGGSGQRGGPPATAAITRGDIVETESVDGKLTYADERTISNVPSGVITGVPVEGATVTRGKPLLRVDDDPVILMYGSLPLYRSLREGVPDGRDVRQLERNLQALGYGDDLTVDTEFTALTSEAVRQWQDDVGLPETGTVEPGQVVFQPAAVRIGDVKTAVGARVGPGGQVLTVTGTKPIVHVDLAASDQAKADKGAAVTVTMPDGREVKGRITSVGSVAEESGGQGQEDAEPTIDVEISLSGKRPGRFDQAPVTVDLESERRRDVLSVPVEALLGLSEGGFGVEVVQAGGMTRIVSVEVGVFGGGRVEITGAGLSEGMKVGVPAS